MDRLGRDRYFLNMLEHVATRGTCQRRKTACILVDDEGRILATGYNGTARGVEHCLTTPCPGAVEKAGSTLQCRAIHAEQNAVAQAGMLGRLDKATRAYTTCSPCQHCAKLLCATNVRQIFCLERYADTTGVEILREAGRVVFCWDGAMLRRI